MIIVGFVLIVVAVVAAFILITQNTGSMDIHALGHAWSVNAYWLIVAGIAVMAVAGLGVALIRWSARRSVVQPDVAASEPDAVAVNPRRRYRARSSS